MSLDKEIYNAYVKSMGGADKLDDTGKKRLKDTLLPNREKGFFPHFKFSFLTS